MPLPSDTYRQLTAMANASDRSNRPTTLLVIPGVAVVVALVVLIVSYRGYASQTRAVESEEFTATRIASLVGQYQALQSKQVDMSEVYPPIAEFELKLLDAYQRAGIPFNTDPRINPPQSQQLPATQTNIVRTTSKCVASNEKLENILQWMHNVVNTPDLKGRVFVYSLALTPLPNNDTWSATIDFAIYETRRN